MEKGSGNAINVVGSEGVAGSAHFALPQSFVRPSTGEGKKKTIHVTQASF